MGSRIIIVLIALLGVSAAFFRPAVPHQVKLTEIPRGGSSEKSAKKNRAFVDASLDNPDVVNDENIHPARKCGFCMG